MPVPHTGNVEVIIKERFGTDDEVGLDGEKADYYRYNCKQSYELCFYRFLGNGRYQ